MSIPMPVKAPAAFQAVTRAALLVRSVLLAIFSESHVVHEVDFFAGLLVSQLVRILAGLNYVKLQHGGTPGRIRTYDQVVMSNRLWAAKLQEHGPRRGFRPRPSTLIRGSECIRLSRTASADADGAELES